MTDKHIHFLMLRFKVEIPPLSLSKEYKIYELKSSKLKVKQVAKN